MDVPDAPPPPPPSTAPPKQAELPRPARPVELPQPEECPLFVWEPAPVSFPRSILRPGKRDWIEAAKPSGGCSCGAAREELIVVTWNVFFGELSAQRRWQALLDETFQQPNLPDVVAFQEATKPFIELVRGHSVVRECYALTGLSTDRGGWYGVMMLVRRTALAAVAVRQTSLPTYMSRTLLSAVFKANKGGPDFVVSTLHAESLGNARLRQQQLAIAGEFGKPYSWHMIGPVFGVSWHD
jgi:hypothetical protein